MIRDHEVGVGSVSPSTFREARGSHGAVPPDATIAPDRELGPERRARLERQLSPITGLGRVDPAAELLECHRILIGPEQPADRPTKETEAVEAPAAQVVLTTFQQDTSHVALERRRGGGNVVREQLLLQRLRCGGDDDALARRECRYQVGEALSNSGAGLGEEMVVAIEGVGNGLGERLLLGSRLELLEHRFETTAGTEVLAHAPEAR